jgi:hypothetical protein
VTYQAVRLPSVDVVLESDGTAGTLALAHGEILMERSSSLDRRGIGASGLVDVIDTTVRGDLFLRSAMDTGTVNSISYSARVGSSAAGVISAVCLNDIVLNKRSSGPTVQGDQTVAASIDGAGVVDGAR